MQLERGFGKQTWNGNIKTTSESVSLNIVRYKTDDLFYFWQQTFKIEPLGGSLKLSFQHIQHVVLYDDVCDVFEMVNDYIVF